MRKVIYLGKAFNVDWEDENGNNLLLINDSESHSSVSAKDTHPLPEDPNEIKSIEIVAHIEAWSTTPTIDMPENHRLYYYDSAKGWFYLTEAGRVQYESYKVVIDEIIDLVHRPAIQKWAEDATTKILS